MGLDQKKRIKLRVEKEMKIKQLQYKRKEAQKGREKSKFTHRQTNFNNCRKQRII